MIKQKRMTWLSSFLLFVGIVFLSLGLIVVIVTSIIPTSLPMDNFDSMMLDDLEIIDPSIIFVVRNVGFIVVFFGVVNIFVSFLLYFNGNK